MSFLGWTAVLGKLLAGENLDRDQARWAMREVMSGNATPAQLGAFMLALRAKGETVDELAGMVDVMLENTLLLDTGTDAVDIVGTGGDLAGTVNISSMAAIVTAGAGIPVLKHGSRSASGKTGSSEMLELLGIRLDLGPEQVSAVFRESGITFFFAPVFHPAMRHVAPVRKELGIPTTFNFLGPLANPAQPIATALGVANRKIAPLMAAELAQRSRAGMVFRSTSGLDELTTGDPVEIWEVCEGRVLESKVDFAAIGLEPVRTEDLVGGDARHNAQIALQLMNEPGSAEIRSIREVTLLNAAAAIACYEIAARSGETKTQGDTLADRILRGYSTAAKSLDSGAAAEKLQHWVAASQQA
jgi:anthranilate phosphoribosyltransferase